MPFRTSLCALRAGSLAFRVTPCILCFWFTQDSGRVPDTMRERRQRDLSLKIWDSGSLRIRNIHTTRLQAPLSCRPWAGPPTPAMYGGLCRSRSEPEQFINTKQNKRQDGRGWAISVAFYLWIPERLRGCMSASKSSGQTQRGAE